MINRTTQVKVIIFKTLAFAKVIYLAINTAIPKEIVLKLKKIQNEFI